MGSESEPSLGVKYIALSRIVQMKTVPVVLDSWYTVPVNKCENCPAKNGLSGTVRTPLKQHHRTLNRSLLQCKAGVITCLSDG